MLSVQFTIELIIALLLVALGGLYHSRTHNFSREAKFFTYALLLGIIAASLALLRESLDYLNIKSKNLGSSILSLELSFYVAQYFLTLIFFEWLHRDEPRWQTIGTAGILSGIVLALNAMFPIVSFSPSIEFLWDTSYTGLGLFVFARGSFIFYKAYELTKDELSQVQSYSLFSITLGFLLEWIASPNNPLHVDSGELYVVAQVAKILGILLFVLVYVFNPRHLYRLPVSLYSLVAFTYEGRIIALLRLKLPNKENDFTRQENLSLGRSIQEIMKDALHFRGRIRTIQTEKATILFAHGKHLGIALMTERSTKFLQGALTNLVKTLDATYPSLQSEGSVSALTQYDIVPVIKGAFPFVDVV